MATEQLVDVSYRGLEVGRRLRLAEVGPHTAYLEHGTPMPVGSILELATDEGLRVAARVLRIHEQVGGSSTPPGMRVRLVEASEEAARWWRPLVTIADPLIPAPPPEPVARVEAASTAGDEAAPETAAGDGTVVEPADSAQKTTVMNTADIEAAIREAEAAAARGGGEAEPGGSDTQVMAAVGPDEGDDANGARGKRKKRRKRKTRG